MNEAWVEEKMALYDRYCALAGEILALFPSPCNIRNGACRRGIPTCCEWKPVCENFENGHGCREKNLLCAFFFCESAEVESPLLAEILRCLEFKARRDLPHLAYYVSRSKYETVLRGMKDEDILSFGGIA